MTDAFFQKKRKRTDKDASVKDRKNGAVRMKSDAKAGPSRLRMKEKARNGIAANGKIRDESDSVDDGSDDEGGIDSMDLRHRYDQGVQESDEDELETPAEAKIRLAKSYLQDLRENEMDPNDADAAEADRQNIASRLQLEVVSHSSHLHHFLAEKVKLLPSGDTSHVLASRGHQSSVTNVLIEASCRFYWTSGKDGQIIRWRLRDGKMLERISKRATDIQRRTKPRISSTSGAARRRARAALSQTDGNKMNGSVLALDDEMHLNELDKYCRHLVPQEEQGHTDEIWALSTSTDGKYLVSGGKDRRICVWSLESGQAVFLKALGGHKDSITALRFRMDSHELFTASSDRTLKLFDVSQLSYIETFFGHQEEVSSLDLLRAEKVVSAGSRDRTVRWWKVRDESQLVFRGGAKSKVRDILEGGELYREEDEDGERKKILSREQWAEGSIDSVAMIDEHTFLSGGDSGTISLWSLAKKKPIFTQSIAHGFHTADTETEGKVQTPRWITSLACLPYGDIFASGSWDGQIRLWKLHSTLKSFSPLLNVPVEGFINSIQLILPNQSGVIGNEAIIDESAWRRRGGLRGGAKKVFSANVEDDVAQIVASSTDANGASANKNNMVILTAGVGQEPSRGRWMRLKEAQNGAIIVPIYLH